MTGRSTWPRTECIEDRRAVQIAGTGNVVCHNRIHGFGDAIDTFLKDAANSAPAYRRARFVNPETAFQSSVKPPGAVQTQITVEVNDLRLSPKSEAIDAGVILPNINDSYEGGSPDLGVYEQGRPLPQYGPR